MSDSSPRRLHVDGLFCFEDIVAVLERFADANELDKPTRGDAFMLLECHVASAAPSAATLHATLRVAGGMNS